MIPVAILAGGLGTRLSEETVVKPKPMVEIGGKPILWHIMRLYAHYGFCKFIVATGYKSEVIHDWFNHTATYRMGNGNFISKEGWDVELLDTGENTQISGRVRRILQHTKKTTMLTYGDGVANVNISSLVAFHMRQHRWATVTAVRPPSRFGRIRFGEDGVLITQFDEKPVDDEDGYGDYINGGFMVLEPDILTLGKYEDDEIFEKVYLPKLAHQYQLAGFVHKGFWQCMDTIREKQLLESIWNTGMAPWKVWKDA